METCKMNKDYLISIDYPYYIKRKSDDKIMRFRIKKLVNKCLNHKCRCRFLKIQLSTSLLLN